MIGRSDADYESVEGDVKIEKLAVKTRGDMLADGVPRIASLSFVAAGSGIMPADGPHAVPPCGIKLVHQAVPCPDRASS